MQNIYSRNLGDGHLYRELDSRPFGAGDERPKRSIWGWKMKLSHLAYFHHALFCAAILAAMFFGMIIQYNLKRAVVEAEQKTLVGVYTGMSIKGLSEVGI